MPEQDPRLIPPDIQPPSQFLDDDGHLRLLGSNIRIAEEQLYQWEIDWEKYLEEFSIAHGVNGGSHPVQLGEWLVWEDGWSLYAYHPGGTERPPPEDPNELRSLMLAYWTARRDIMQRELVWMRGRIETLESIQRFKSMPIRTSAVRWNKGIGEDGFSFYTPQLIEEKLDLSRHYTAMEDLQKDVELCEREVKELSNG